MNNEQKKPDHRPLWSGRQWKSAVGLAAALVAGIGCQSSATSASLGEWEELFRLPGVRVTAFDMAPDGTLFVATGGALFCAFPDNPANWSLATNTDRFPVEIHAVSRDQAFAWVRYGDVYQWSVQHGWSIVAPIPDSLVLVDGTVRRVWVWDWWIAGAHEVYLAGDAGLVLRYDGQSWTRVVAEGVPQLKWYQIDGGTSTTVLAGAEVWKRVGLTWSRLPDATVNGGWCGPTALVVRPTDVVLAGHRGTPCLLRFDNGTWQVMHDQLRDFRDLPSGGALQSDGSALVWSSAGDVARIAGTTVTVYPIPALFDFSGAALHEGYVYFAGTLSGNGVVGRIRQP